MFIYQKSFWNKEEGGLLPDNKIGQICWTTFGFGQFVSTLSFIHLTEKHFVSWNFILNELNGLKTIFVLKYRLHHVIQSYNSLNLIARA